MTSSEAILDKLTEIEKCAAAATPEPWLADHGDKNASTRGTKRKYSYVRAEEGLVLQRTSHHANETKFLANINDAEFIASARSTNPAMARALRAAVPALMEMRGVLSAHEWAIRSDHGNSNYELVRSKLDIALAAIAKELGV